MRTGDYTRRWLDAELDELLGGLAAVALEGPKAVGKTATALRRARTVHALDRPGERAVVAADPGRLVEDPPPVLIDEWQYVPEVWDRVRRAVDSDPTPGRFLLTGSASPVKPGTHSGAGRIVSVRMRPLALSERVAEPPTVSLRELLAGGRPAVAGRSSMTLAAYTDELVASGFPGLRRLPSRALRAQLDSYLTRIADRDFPELGHELRNPVRLRRWMAAYAAATSTTTSLEKIRRAAERGEGDTPTAKTTVIAYRDVLERLFVLDPLLGWQPSRNPLGQLALPPKHHLADPALAARLVGASTTSLLAGEAAGPRIPRDGTQLGALFESLVTLSVRVYAQAAEAAMVGHLRTKGGRHEVDLIVERDDGRVIALEVKLGAVPSDHDVRHLHWLAREIRDDLLDSVVITTGEEAYRRPDGIAVVPAALLGP